MKVFDQAGQTKKKFRLVLNRFFTSFIVLAMAVGFSSGVQAQRDALVDQAVNANSICAADVLGNTFGNCSAGEISISEVVDVTFVGGTPDECVAGETLTISSATVNYSINTQARSDLTMWVGDQEGADPRQYATADLTCTAYSLPAPFADPATLANPFGNRTDDDDQCGDLALSVDQASRTFTNFDVSCQDNDNDGTSDLLILLTWDQSKDDNCGFDPGDPDQGLAPQEFPTVGARSKCDYQLRAGQLPVVFPPILTLVKVVTNNSGGTAVVSNWNLTADGPTSGISGASGSDAVTAVVVEAGDYDLGETGPSGYDGTWSCDGGTLVDDTLTLTNVAGTPGDPGEVARTVTCTLTNDDQPATLTLQKTVVNNNGGSAANTDWTLTATGPTTISGAHGTGPVTGATVNAGSYTLSETGPAGYSPGAWSCPGATLDGNSLTLANGDSVICTITNDDVPAKLTLNKIVNNTSGGNAVVGDWTLTADAITFTSGVQQDVAADTYTLAESGPGGYTPSTWVCTGTGDFSSVPDIVLVNGDVASCTIQNTDIAPGLTLVKSVTNTYGGNDLASSFNLTLTGADGTHTGGVDYSDGATPTVQSNLSYTVSETPNAGYTLTGITCLDGETNVGTTFSLNEGQNVTCTFNNQDQAPSLTVAKLVNNIAGSLTPADFILRVAGCDLANVAYASGDTVTGAESNCALTVSEDTPPAGYTQTSIGCVDTGNGNAIVPHPVTLNEGQAVTCTITNDEVPAGSITVTKNVINLDGGTLEASAFGLNLAATGTDCNAPGAISSGYTLSNPGNACVYTVTEPTVPDGYSMTGIVCTEQGGTVDDGVFTFANGETWACVVTNDDMAATLTLTKTVTTDHGGTAAADAWTLEASGPTTISGTHGHDDVTGAAVSAGSYTLSETGGPDDYTPSSWSCVEDGENAVSATPLVLALGDVVTCNITNDDDPASLTLNKTVINNNGGTAVKGQWTLSANTVAFTQETATPVSAATYTLTESGPDGYAPTGDWVCTGDGTFTSPNQIELGLGDVAECTIVNDDIAPRLTLVKSLTVDNGGTATVDSFTLTLQGEDGVHNTAQNYSNNATPTVMANVEYLMDEVGLDGYEIVDPGAVCADTGGEGDIPMDHPVTLALDQDVTCTIENDDIAPTLSLIKSVTNDDGDTLTAADFTLTLTGTDDGTHDSGADYASGDTPAIFAGVEYSVSEDTVPDFYDPDAVTITCEDTDTNAEIVNPFTPLLAQNIECTVANDDLPPTLTLVKVVNNDEGGQLTAADFAITLTGTDTVHDSGVNYVDGDSPDIRGTIEYTVSESPPEGYEVSSIVCEDAEGDVGSTFTAVSGDDITCTVTNEDVPPIGAFFLVTKEYTDSNPNSVKVQLTCNTGLQLIQDYPIDSEVPVKFVVTSYEPGGMDCWVEEIEAPFGYEATFLADIIEGEAGDVRSEPEACHYDAVVGGEFSCSIVNAPAPVDVVVYKEWIDDDGEAESVVFMLARAEYVCYDVLDGPAGSPTNREGTLVFEGNSFDTIEYLYPYYGSNSYCEINEILVESVVDYDDSECTRIAVTLGGSGSCTIYNTVFFEGIPSLSQYGLMILALLMFGIGAVGFRRFA